MSTLTAIRAHLRIVCIARKVTYGHLTTLIVCIVRLSIQQLKWQQKSPFAGLGFSLSGLIPSFCSGKRSGTLTLLRRAGRCGSYATYFFIYSTSVIFQCLNEGLMNIDDLKEVRL